MGIWDIFFPQPLLVPVDAENDSLEFEDIQPSYRTIRQRSRVLRQIRDSHLRLRRTFIVYQHDRTTYRLPVLDENGEVRRSQSAPIMRLWYD